MSRHAGAATFSRRLRGSPLVGAIISPKEDLHESRQPCLALASSAETVRPMKQHCLGLGQMAQRMGRRAFLSEMETVPPWADLVTLVSPYLHETMLRVRFIQQWFALSDPVMEEALNDTPVLREFAGPEGSDERLTRPRS